VHLRRGLAGIGVAVDQHRRLFGRGVDAALAALGQIALAGLLALAGLDATLPGADVEEQVAVGEVRPVVDADQSFGIVEAAPVAGAVQIDGAGLLLAARAERIRVERRAGADREDRPERRA
jgi:hypothetical protein